MTNRIWVLGAPDPEMELIERLLRQCGERIEYATVWRDGVRRRVTPAEAYAPDVEIGAGLRGLRATAYMVECAPAVLVGSAIDGIDWAGAAITIDHHRPGDPGYGRPPSEFLPASSIGQVIEHLARVVPLGWETIPGPSWPWDPGTYELFDARRRVWRSDPGVYATGSGEWDWAFSFAVGCWYIVPKDLVLAAAADHCLAAAYRGECPGVDPDELMKWRAETRAKHQKRPVEDILADVERARKALREAPRIDLAGAVRDMRDAFTVTTVLVAPFAEGATVDAAGVGDSREVVFGDLAEGTWDEGGHHTFVRRGVPELPEAAAREGVAYLATVTDRDGRRKVVLGGHTTPETVEAFLTEWGPAQGLVDVYGDPARGFAGGYLEKAP